MLYVNFFREYNCIFTVIVHVAIGHNVVLLLFRSRVENILTYEDFLVFIID